MNFNLLPLLEGAANPADAMSGGMGTMFIVEVVIMIGVFIAVIILPQRKKEKEQKAMRDGIQLGDEVTTIGGIMGIVVKKDTDHDCVVIETGGGKSKIRVKMWAISENLTKHDESDDLGKKK